MASSHDSIVKSRQREHWVDNLRVVIIAGVIVAHAATAYVVDVPWYYDDERATSGVWPVLLSFPVITGALFALGPLFLLAGWFSARSLAHRGPAAFAGSRLVRLGVPLLVFVVLINPLADYLGNLRSEPRSLVSYLGTTQLSVMWFVAALLAFSLAYAALRGVRPAAPLRPPQWPGALAAAALVIAVSSYAVWQLWPWDAQTYLNPRLAEWPQGAVLFALGVRVGEAGWQGDLPPLLARRLGWVAAAALAILEALVAVELARGQFEPLVAGASWPTMAFALLDGVIAVAGTLWFIVRLRGRWPTHGPLVDKAGRASYATYFSHPLVLTAVMVALAFVALAPEIKFVLVAAVAVPVCFAAGYALTRMPGISKVL